MMENAGFTGLEIVTETGFDSSPKTRGVLVRAEKPAKNAMKPSEKPREMIFDPAQAAGSAHEAKPDPRPEGGVDALIRKALDLGASQARVIDTDSVVVEEWVLWKCLYGCPMYGKDGFHPPAAPGIEETRKVMGQYSTALLLNGADGGAISEVACKLEGEAYHMGYYKAFALTALVPGSPKPAAAPGGG